MGWLVPPESYVTWTQSRSVPGQSAVTSQKGLQALPTHSVPAMHSVPVVHFW